MDALLDPQKSSSEPHNMESGEGNRLLPSQTWRSNYNTALRKCKAMREEHEIAKVVLGTMRTVKEAELYDEIPLFCKT